MAILTLSSQEPTPEAPTDCSVEGNDAGLVISKFLVAGCQTHGPHVGPGNLGIDSFSIVKKKKTDLAP